MEGTTPAPSTLAPARPLAACASCGAALRPNAPWCTLCLTPADPPAAPPAAPLPVDAPPVEAVPVEAVPDEAVPVAPASRADASWPCTACGHANPLERDACDACGSGFLSRLSSQDAASLVLPLIGDMRRFQRGQPFVLIGLVLTGALVVFILSAVLGLLLG